MRPRSLRTRKEFEAELAKGPRLVLFYSSWCPFCSSFVPDFDALACGPEGCLLKVCTDDLPELEDMFAIEVVPTVIYFSSGKPKARLDGELGRGLTREKLRTFAGRHLEGKAGK